MKKIVFMWAILLFWLMAHGERLSATEGNWRADFNRLCAQTAGAEKLSGEELHRLIAESEELLQIVEASDDPEEKIYLIRLKKCRNFFIFMQQIAEKPNQ